MLNLFLFGTPRLERNHTTIEFDTRKAIALLAFLAVTRQTHSRDALATLLYPDYDQTHARAALRRTLSTLNTALSDDTLEIDRETIRLNPRAKLVIDVVEFQRALDECKKHKHPASEVCPKCVKALTHAAELYRNDFLAGFTLRDSSNFDDWQFFTAENLRRELAKTLEKLAAHFGDERDYEPAIAYTRRWVALDPLHEPAHRQLMRLYAMSHQRAAALRQYQECVRVLAQELGVQPLEETIRFYEDLTANKIVEDAQWVQPSSADLTAAHYPLVGRSPEIEKLKQTYANVRSNGQLIIIEGEAGIGKTRLAEEFLAPVRAGNGIVLVGRAYEGETNLAYGIFVEALRALLGRKDWCDKIPSVWRSQIARLVPEIGKGPSPEPLSNAGARSRFFEGISQTLFAILRGKSPGVLFFDDVQWADSASIDLLTYLVQRLRGRPLGIIVAWRAENAEALERFRQQITQAQRANLVTTLVLARLTPLAVTQLVASMVGEAATLTQSISARLHRETEGLPFFVVEYLHALDRGASEISDWSLPSGVQSLLHARLTSVSETGKQLLGAAAVIGRSFDFDTLRQAGGRTEEETIKTLEELAAHGLIREISAEQLQYDFAHEKLRELAYAETSTPRRRLLHRRTAEALVNRARTLRETGALASQIARHYQRSGENSSAAEYFKLAGDHARSLYANAEALAHYRAAQSLGHPQVAMLSDAVGDMQTLLGDYADALLSYGAASAACEPDRLSRIEHKRGNVHHRRGEYEIAETHFERALNAMGEKVLAVERAKLFADWSLTAHQRCHSARADELAHRALALAENTSDKSALARVRNILGVLARSRGENEQARYQLEQSCAIAESLDDPSVRIAALNNLALVCRDGGDLPRAMALCETALVLCNAQGDRHRQAALHNNLADLLHAFGESEQAMAHLEQAVTAFAEINVEAGAMQPEIWKLVEW